MYKRGKMATLSNIISNNFFKETETELFEYVERNELFLVLIWLGTLAYYNDYVNN